jgi:hypothetical protein
VATPRDLLSASLREIGVLAGGDAAQFDDANDALNALNRWLDSLALEPLSIYTRTRSTFPVVANRGDYYLGPLAGTASTDNDVSDGFDTDWTTAPDDWSDASSGAGQLINDTTAYQDGGHCVELFPSSGVAALAREFDANPGDRVTISFYGYNANSDGVAGLIVQNTSTDNYLTSDGEWQADVTFAVQFPQSPDVFGLRTITFNVETDDIIGTVQSTVACGLTVTFQTEDGICRVDTFSLTSKGGLTIPRPTRLVAGEVRLIDTNTDPDFEIDLTQFTDDTWAGLTTKSQTSNQPAYWHYEPTYPNGTLNLWPIPTGSGFEIAIYTATRVPRFETLDDIVSLPDGYEEMIVQNMALRLCPSYKVQPSPLTVKFAADSLAAVKRANIRTKDMTFPGGALIGNRPWFDIRSGR